MSKLCQCIVKRLKSNTNLVYWAGIASKKADCDTNDRHASEMENMVDEILESDCVCEKKEVCRCRYHNDVCVGAPQRNGVCGLCPPNCFGKQSQPSEKKDALHEYLSKENPKEEDKEVLLKAYGYPDVPKQSQSPCDHKWKKIFFPAFTVLNDHWQPQFGESYNSFFPLFTCRKCGLVTCLDPNQ